MFLLIIISSVFAMTAAFITLSASKAVKGYGAGVCHLAGRSILAEYDTELKNRYGIIAFKGDNTEICRKLKYYTDYSFRRSGFAHVESVTSNLKKYSLLDCEIFEEQIVSHAGMCLAGNMLGDSQDEEESVPDNSEENRVLRNEKIINSLPSKSYETGGISIRSLVDRIKEISSVSELVEVGKKEYFTDLYIMSIFNRHSKKVSSTDTFFKNECEYIIEGSYDDNQNRKLVKRHIVELRTALNMAYIYSNSKMMAEVETAAALITPGPEAAATQLVLITLWAAAEAENDYHILERNKKVPVYKDKSTWAIDLESVVKNKTEGYVAPDEYKGFTYDGYLEVLMCAVDKKTKLFRMMDLIQINMQGTYSGDFYIRKYNTGLQFLEKIGNREFEFDEKY